MARKKVKYFIPGALALIMGIAAFCMMFLEAVKYTADIGIASGSYSYTGMQLAFGYTKTSGSGALSVSTTILNFNILALLAFALPLAGGIIALITKNGMLSKVLSTACFVAGAVLLFTVTGYAATGMADAQKALVEHLTASIGTGAIVAAVLSIVGAIICFFKGAIAKLIK